MNILLLGKNGQVGSELQRALAPLGAVTALGRDAEQGLCGDLEQPDALRETVRQLQPDVVVNAAAYTAVDSAEDEAERAEAVNARAPGVLAEEAARLNAWFVHYSTDYVFDGSGDRPWCEDDVPAPINVYGASKRAGEWAVHAAGAKHLVFRTQWVYAAQGKNFIRTMLRLASERDALQVIDDQFGAPTGAELIADVTAHALRRVVAQPELGGTYHLAADGQTTWCGYARFVIAAARAAGWPVKVGDSAIAAVDSEAFPTTARRPRNSRLDTRRLREAFDLALPDWRDGVERAVSEIVRTMPEP